MTAPRKPREAHWPESGQCTSPEAERSVLGSVLIDNAVLPGVQAILEPSHFYDPRHAAIFEGMVALGLRREPIDIVTLAGALRPGGRLAFVGGAPYLVELTDLVATTAHVGSHARMVRDQAVSRGWVDLGWRVAQESAAGKSPGDIASMVRQEGLRLVQGLEADDAMKPLSGLIEQRFEEIEKAAEATAEGSVPLLGMPAGLRDLDVLTGGARSGQLGITGARPGMGKTALSLKRLRTGAAWEKRRAEALGRPAWPSVMFSLEMPNPELVSRLLCSVARVDGQVLKSMIITQDQLVSLLAAANVLHGLPIFIHDGTRLTLDRMHAHLQTLKARYGGIAQVEIDYLQLMKAGGEWGSREAEIGEISRRLKEMAKEFECPFNALAQLNRKCEERPDKRPLCSDLRDSGSIEQDADIITFIYRDEVYNKDTEDRGIAELIVAKQRNGPTGTARVRWVRAITEFEDLAETEAGDPFSDSVAADAFAGEGLPDLDV